MNNGNTDENVAPRQSAGHEAQSTAHGSPGARLAAERERYGLTIEQVAGQINLAPRQIHALETDDYAQLPGMVIARGFLRAYAKLLRLDPEPLLTDLVEKSAPSTPASHRGTLSASFSESPMRPLNGPPRTKKIRYVIFVVLAVIVIATVANASGFLPGGLTQWMSRMGFSSIIGAYPKTGEKSNDISTAALSLSIESDNTDKEKSLGKSLRPVMSETVPAAAGTATGTTLSNDNTTQSNTTQASTSQKKTLSTDRSESLSLDFARPNSTTSVVAPIPLVLNVVEDSWLEVKRADNTILVAKTAKAGSVETVEVDGPVTVTIGNIAGVKATFRNVPLSLTNGAKGNTVKLHLK